jgi:hypothetical protein
LGSRARREVTRNRNPAVKNCEGSFEEVGDLAPDRSSHWKVAF